MSPPYSQTFAVSTSPSQRALQRIVTAATQRQCEIVSLTWQQEVAGARLELEVAGAEWHVRRLGEWLAALVDVTEVADPFAPGRRQAWAADLAFQGWRPTPSLDGD